MHAFAGVHVSTLAIPRINYACNGYNYVYINYIAR